MNLSEHPSQHLWPQLSPDPDSEPITPDLNPECSPQALLQLDVCCVQTGEKLAVCPSGAVCSTSVSVAFPQGDDMDAADFAQALFNITSSGIVQV